MREVKNNVREVLGQDFEYHFYAMSKVLRIVERYIKTGRERRVEL